VARFRVNVFPAARLVAAAFSPLPPRDPHTGGARLPVPVIELSSSSEASCCSRSGGAGKSTFPAALIDRINSERRVHIITLETRSSTCSSNRLSVVVHRELGNA